jgi:hypothetical protein
MKEIHLQKVTQIDKIIKFDVTNNGRRNRVLCKTWVITYNMLRSDNIVLKK